MYIYAHGTDLIDSSGYYLYKTIFHILQWINENFRTLNYILLSAVNLNHIVTFEWRH